MILIMFQKDLDYLPTLREIRDEIIKAQLHDIQIKKQNWTNQTKFENIQSFYKMHWKLIFDLADLNDLD